MCKDCKASELGRQRVAEHMAAIEACHALNINPGTAGFIVKYARTRVIPQGEHEGTQAALERYNRAAAAVKALHNDYVWERGRQAALAHRARAYRHTYKISYRSVRVSGQGARGPVFHVYFPGTHAELKDFLTYGFRQGWPHCRYQGYMRIAE